MTRRRPMHAAARRADGGTGPVDLHAHTTFSDGLFSPEELVEQAAARGLTAIGVTDHDTLEGVDRALAAGRRFGIEVVPGAELSCSVNGVDLHILGYFLDARDAEVNEFFQSMRGHREDRARRTVVRLGELGKPVSFERIKLMAGAGAIGRPHIAQAMVEEGLVPNIEEAFRWYIGYDGPAYVPKVKISPEEGVGFIKEHGGVAVVAHPGTYRNDNAVYAAILAGVDGIEVWHTDHDKRAVALYDELARKNGLLQTGGSDCHGGRKEGRVFLGEVTVPYAILAALKRFHRAHRRR